MDTIFMSEPHPLPPYKNLGARLLKLRQKLRESTAEVSGAVEIDPEVLERIEQGLELPSEDVLLLLMNHFGLHDDEAVQLWELAGYDRTDRGPMLNSDEQPSNKQAVFMLLGMDARIVYTNGVDISADPSGVVMNFTQYADPAQQAIPVARVGMSTAQAERVLKQLQQALLRSTYASGPKALLAPEKPKSPRRKPRKRAG